jgi:hypothetical protein
MHHLPTWDNERAGLALDSCPEVVRGSAQSLHKNVKLILIYIYQSLCYTLVAFSFLILHVIARTPWTGDQSVVRPLHIQKQNKRRQTSMPWVGFEPTISAFERAKTVHAIDRAATVIGSIQSHGSAFTRFLCIHGSTALCSTLAAFFSLLIFYTVDRTLWTGDQPVARPLPTHRTTQTRN